MEKNSNIRENGKFKVLITGASKGIGFSAAKILTEKGFTVIGTSRDPDKMKNSQIIPGVKYLPLDFSDRTSIDNCINQSGGEIDILINNAGISQIGSIEEINLSDALNLFQIDFWGHIQLIKGFLKGMRENNRGKIINISSLAGRNPAPYSTFYAAAKHALEGFSRGLLYELTGTNIKVCIIAPAYIKTDIPQVETFYPDSPYIDKILRARTIRDEKIKNGDNPEKVGKLIYKIIKNNNPGFYYPVGKNIHFQTFLMKHLPEKLKDKIIRNMYGI